ncbi:MAG: hypothetical protein M3P96_14505 [Actinomycetota bacterium]|nr:hypothetical protein [Actinomycetota bacterium]
MDAIVVLLPFLLLLLGVVLVGLVAARSSARKRRQAEAEHAAQIAQIKRAAEEDVIRFGEDLTSLDLEVQLAAAGRKLDEAGRQDYRRALDEYEAAKAALEAVHRPEDVRAVTQALEDGRYALACVQARLEGRPLPTRRPPCFFNPQHGPSVDDVEWSPPRGALRKVPVCAADAERVRVGAEPDSRKVLVDGQRRPYWEGGPGYGSYAQGYFSPFAMSGLLPGILMGAVLTGGFGGWGDGGYGEGYSEGFDAGQDDVGGGEEFGGFDGGGDFGGGDFGGGDFGGGDF